MKHIVNGISIIVLMFIILYLTWLKDSTKEKIAEKSYNLGHLKGEDLILKLLVSDSLTIDNYVKGNYIDSIKFKQEINIVYE